ncbi:hypothetical protein ACSQ67_025146 [Phaseolus vulgaris]
MNLNYEQKLQVVAKFILDHEARASDSPPFEEELGIRATLKPHQVEGVSWLIRRYKLGVNVVLGETVTLSMCFVALNVLECERNYGWHEVLTRWVDRHSLSLGMRYTLFNSVSELV